MFVFLTEPAHDFELQRRQETSFVATCRGIWKIALPGRSKPSEERIIHWSFLPTI